ncbi:MAG: hypothetical protein ACE5KD_00580 [Candidatus Bathyarchaeia archaeon]
MKKILIPIIILLLLPVVNACDASIKTLTVSPSQATAGSTVTITADIEFHVSGTDRGWKSGLLVPSCDFLLEGGIIPQTVPFSLLATIDIGQEFQCCVGNLNYADKYVTVECAGYEQLGCSKIETISLTPRAPDVGFCDHCGTGERSCESNPNLYYDGEAWYAGVLAVYNGCYDEVIDAGEEFEEYAKKSFSIYVSKAVEDGDVGQPCEEDWWNCQIGGLPLTYGDLIILLVLISIVSIIIWVVSKRWL